MCVWVRAYVCVCVLAVVCVCVWPTFIMHTYVIGRSIYLSITIDGRFTYIYTYVHVYIRTCMYTQMSVAGNASLELRNETFAPTPRAISTTGAPAPPAAARCNASELSRLQYCSGHGVCQPPTASPSAGDVCCVCEPGFYSCTCALSRARSVALDAWMASTGGALRDAMDRRGSVLCGYSELACPKIETVAVAKVGKCAASLADCLDDELLATQEEACRGRGGSVKWSGLRCISTDVHSASINPVIPPCEPGQRRCGGRCMTPSLGDSTEARACEQGNCSSAQHVACPDGRMCAPTLIECLTSFSWFGCPSGLIGCPSDPRRCVNDMQSCAELVGCPQQQQRCGLLRDRGRVQFDVRGGNLMPQPVCRPACSLGDMLWFKADAQTAELPFDLAIALHFVDFLRPLRVLMRFALPAYSVRMLLPSSFVPRAVLVLRQAPSSTVILGGFSRFLSVDALASAVIEISTTGAVDFLHPFAVDIAIADDEAAVACDELLSSMAMYVWNVNLSAPLSLGSCRRGVLAPCSCSVQSQVLGSYAVVELAAVQSAAQQPVPADACTPEAWSPWSPCTASCGDAGWRSRSRHAADLQRCPSWEEAGRCNRIPCPVDCALQHWSGWFGCMHSCGRGYQSRYRTFRHAGANAVFRPPSDI